MPTAAVAVLFVLLGASSPSRAAEASVTEGDVVLIERVGPAAATSLFAFSDAVLYLPEEGSAYLLLPSGEGAS